MFCGWVGGEHVHTTELYTLKGLEIKIFLLKNIIGSFSSPECLDQNFQSVECFCFFASNRRWLSARHHAGVRDSDINHMAGHPERAHSPDKTAA